MIMVGPSRLSVFFIRNADLQPSGPDAFAARLRNGLRANGWLFQPDDGARALDGGLTRAAVGTYARGMTTSAERLRDARAKTDSALARVRADPGASPVLVAVVNEFAKKAEKAVHHDDERTAVIELEQAGDSAKAAAEADNGVAEVTRQAVLDAHLAICIAKSKL